MANAVVLSKAFFELKSYRDLTTDERCVLQEMMAKLNRLRDDENVRANGRLGFSAREAAKRCGIDRKTAMSSIDQLVRRGFIACTDKSNYERKGVASTYRLTMFKCDVTDAPPTHEYRDPMILVKAEIRAGGEVVEFTSPKVEITLGPAVAENDPAAEAA
jgi:hypothetical protein